MWAQDPQNSLPLFRACGMRVFLVKSLALAGGQKSLKFADVAANSRRFFGPSGAAARQTVLFTDGADGSSGGR